MKNVKKIGIFFIPFIAFFLRLKDILYGLPNGINIYHKVPYFADEAIVLNDFRWLIVFLHTKSPTYLLNWTYTFLGRALAFPIYALTVLLTKLEFASYSPEVIEVLKVMQMTLSGRIVSLISSFLILIVMFKLLKLLKAKPVFIWLAFIFLGFNSADILMSLQSKANALMNLFILICLYFSILWVKGRGKKIKYILLAAGCSALATAARINGVMSLFIVFFSFGLNYDFKPKRLFLKRKTLFWILITFVLTLAIAYPVTFIAPLEFFRLWGGIGSGNLTTEVNWLGALRNLRYLTGGKIGVGVLMTIAGLSIFYFKNMAKSEKIVTSWFYLYLAIAGATQSPIVRYLYPVLAVYVLVFWIVFKQWFNYLKKRSFFALSIVVGILGLNFLTNLFLGLSMLDFYRGEDIRLEAARYVDDNIPKDSSIGTYLFPEFWAPYVPLNYDKYDLISYRAREEFSVGQQSLFPWWRSNDNRPDYLVVERRGYSNPGFQEFFGVEDNYKEIKTFDRKLKDFGPFVFSKDYAASYATMVRIFEKI